MADLDEMRCRDWVRLHGEPYVFTTDFVGFGIPVSRDELDALEAERAELVERLRVVEAENERLRAHRDRLRAHLAVLANKAPDRSTFTIVAENPWLSIARQLVAGEVL
jgi:hypothetical protein